MFNNIACVLLIASLSFTIPSYGQPPFAVPAKNAFFFYLKDYPKDGTPSWGDERWAANAIGHSQLNWFIGANERNWVGKTNNANYAIWKIPVSMSLDQDFDGKPGVQKFELQNSNTSAIFKEYGHLGDFDCFSHSGIEYLIVPLTGGSNPIIAFFKASNLKLINYAYIDQRDIGWCAVSKKDGRLYTSRDNASSFYKYRIDWNIILGGKKRNGLKLTDIKKMNDRGGKPLTIPNMQGGEFTGDGELLYVSSGAIDCFGHSSNDPTDGINVFRTSDWTRIQQSTNHQRAPYKTFCFDFNFDNSGCWGREPEGLTIWDLDDGRAPHIRGQLHVLSDNHNFASSNNVTLKHYTGYDGPRDITVKTFRPRGLPANSPELRNFLDKNESFMGCSRISNNAPAIFPLGTTVVTFTVTDRETVKVKHTAKVKVRLDPALISQNLNTGSIKDSATSPFPDIYSLAPNPANSYVTVSALPGATLIIRVIDQNAILRKAFYNVKSGQKLDISEFGNGIYFIEITDIHTGVKTTRKIIKVN
jgi:hypothetical protein